MQTVTLGDEEARRRGTTKTVNERKAPPTFDILVELVNRSEVLVHRDTAAAVDTLLRGYQPRGERRRQTEDGRVEVEENQPEAVAPAFVPPASPFAAPERPQPAGPQRCYPHGVSRELLERTARDLGVDLRIVARPEQADLIVALRTRAEDLGLKRIVRQSDAPLHYVKRNTTAELRRLLQKTFNIVQGVDEEEIQDTVRETEAAIRQVEESGGAVPLSPRRPALRKMQHRMISGHGLVAESVGREPSRHLVVRSPEGRDEAL